jgi:hypothetical protein
MKHPKLFSSILLGGLLLFSSSGAAAPKASRQSKRSPADRICARLDCSDAQKDEIGDIVKQLRQQQRSAMARMHALSQRVTEELKRARPDEAALFEAYGEIDRLHLSLRDAIHDTVIAIHGTLNARQREMAAPMLARMLLSPPRDKSARGRGHRGMRPPGADGLRHGEQHRGAGRR